MAKHDMTMPQFYPLSTPRCTGAGFTKWTSRGCKAKYVPCGLVDEESGALHLTFGSSSTTRDCIVEGLEATWAAWDAQDKAATSRRQINMDNGPARRGKRTPCLPRMGQLADNIQKPIPRRYDPPSHSQENPLERCWGILELPWHGAKRIDAETMVAWAKRMTWKGIHPVVALSRTRSQKGISLGKAAMQAIAERLERHPALPTYDLVIKPVSTS